MSKCENMTGETIQLWGTVCGPPSQNHRGLL